MKSGAHAKKETAEAVSFSLAGCFALYGRSRLVLLVLDTLENEDGDQHRKTRKVSDRAGDDHQQAAGDQRDAADPLHIADQVAHQAGGDRRHTEGRGDDDGGNAQEVDVAANEDQGVIVSKDVGDLRVASANESWLSVLTLILDTPRSIAFLIMSAGIPVPP